MKSSDVKDGILIKKYEFLEKKLNISLLGTSNFFILEHSLINQQKLQFIYPTVYTSYL